MNFFLFILANYTSSPRRRAAFAADSSPPKYISSKMHYGPPNPGQDHQLERASHCRATPTTPSVHPAKTRKVALQIKVCSCSSEEHLFCGLSAEAGAQSIILSLYVFCWHNKEWPMLLAGVKTSEIDP